MLDGAPGAVAGPAVEVVAQRGDGLDERLAAAFDDLGGARRCIVGMDTPQVTPALLREALAALDDHDAVARSGDRRRLLVHRAARPDPRRCSASR